MTQSNPTACDIVYPPGLLKSLADPGNTQYAPSPLGQVRAREAIAQYYAQRGHDVHPDNIVLTASTSEAYSFVFKLLIDSGQAVLFPQPSYPLLDHLAQLNDVAIARYRLRYEDQAWDMELPALETAMHEACKAIVLVHPNNPTGSFLKRRQWDILRKRMEQSPVALISDEVFHDYAYGQDPQRMSSLAGQDAILSFSLNGISKMLALPQMKLSWICVGGPPDLRKDAMARLEMIADTYLSVNTPAQNALCQWLAMRQAIQGQIIQRVCSNRAQLCSRPWGDLGAEVLQAEGGWYAILRVPATKTEEEWALELLEEKHVLVHPGYFFDFEQEAYLVLSLLPPKTVFAEALEGIWDILAR